MWPPGSTPGLRRKPCCTHRTVANGRLSLISTRWAWATLIGSSAQICSSRSPPVQAGWSRSTRNGGRSATEAGRRSSTPAARYRAGPKPKVTVSRAGRSPSSASVSASAGLPWVRRAASSVSSRSIRPSAARSVPARSVNATNAACACGSVVTPACRAPWNGSTRAPTLATGVVSAAAGDCPLLVRVAAMAAPPARAPPAARAPPVSRPRLLTGRAGGESVTMRGSCSSPAWRSSRASAGRALGRSSPARR